MLILHPMTPFFYSVHTQWPPFFHANFCVLRAHFEKFKDFVAILAENLQILPWNCIFAHWMTPIFGSPHQKNLFFWCPHRMTPFFRWNLTPNAPYFCSPVGTCTSLSNLSAPLGVHVGLAALILYFDCLRRESNFLASTRRVTALCVCVCCIICV